MFDPPAIVQPFAPAQQRLMVQEDDALSVMVRAYHFSLLRGQSEREAMREALRALTESDFIGPEMTGPGKRHASRKQLRKVRAALSTIAARA